MGQLSITAVDVVVVAVVLISAFLAMWRGFVSEVFTIFEWVAAAYAALRFTPTFQPLLKSVISPPWLEYIVVFVGTFLIVIIPLSIMAHRLSEMIKRSEIGPVDRSMGFVFGMARGLVIIGLAYIAFAALVPQPDRPAALTQARLFPMIQNTSKVLLDILPETPREFAALRSENQASSGDGNEAETQAPESSGAREPGALERFFGATGGSQDSSR